MIETLVVIIVGVSLVVCASALMSPGVWGAVFEAM